MTMMMKRCSRRIVVDQSHLRQSLYRQSLPSQGLRSQRVWRYGRMWKIKHLRKGPKTSPIRSQNRSLKSTQKGTPIGMKETVTRQMVIRS